ncbi:MAG: hypothetical protein JSV05_00620 [Candidatus Bathyarchaeota archaeon]|nr:MAG: hypothetical protein JSV05_00620 [Candidatus Bathyarchaeota archaeon]
MLSRAILKSTHSKFHLSFNIENIDGIFPSFVPGNFVVLHGLPAILHLSMLLCVRAQRSYQLGGLETTVVFIDGGNTFRLYNVSHIAQLHELSPKVVLERIFISRAFTAYQMTSLILDELQGTIEEHDSKLVIVSDIAGPYLNTDLPKREAREVFNQLTKSLLKLAEESRVLVVATYLLHHPSERNFFFKTLVLGRADVVASVKPSRYGQQFVLEKSALLEKMHFPQRILNSRNL